jgi:hypothetical protein
MFDLSFWLNSLSNLIATIVGIAIGLPFALWIDRIVRKRDETERAKEARQRALKILTLLKLELESNLESIDHFNKDLANFHYPVATESWHAFSDGGELQWINDPEVVFGLSSVYSQINDYRFLLEKYFDAFFFPGSMGNLNNKETLLRSVIKSRDASIPHVRATIKLLDERISRS